MPKRLAGQYTRAGRLFWLDINEAYQKQTLSLTVGNTLFAPSCLRPLFCAPVLSASWLELGTLWTTF